MLSQIYNARVPQNVPQMIFGKLENCSRSPIDFGGLFMFPKVPRSMLPYFKEDDKSFQGEDGVMRLKRMLVLAVKSFSEEEG